MVYWNKYIYKQLTNNFVFLFHFWLSWVINTVTLGSDNLSLITEIFLFQSELF